MIRKAYLIKKAFRYFFAAAILSAAASRFAVTTDAVIVGHLIGGDGLSAINLILPPIVILSAVAAMLAAGTGISVAKAFGQQNKSLAANIFTVSIMLSSAAGTLFAGLFFTFGDRLLDLLYPTAEQLPLAKEYLLYYAPGVIFLFAGLNMQFLLNADGRPATATKLIVFSGVVNIVLDIVFIKYLGMGMGGSALATGISYVVMALSSLPCILKKGGSFHWNFPGVHLFCKIPADIFRNGLFVLSNNTVAALFIFLINLIIIRISDNPGLFTWSVCVQILSLASIVINGGNQVILGLGSVLAGENDLCGLRLLYKNTLAKLGLIFILFLASVLIWPDWLPLLFQTGGANIPENCGRSIGIFSLMFLPFSLIMISTSLYQILEHRILGILLSMAVFLAMLLSALGLSIVSPAALWWGFPLGCSAVLAVQFFYCAKIHSRYPWLHFFTLIPKKNNGEILDISVNYNRESLIEALPLIKDFGKKNNLPQKLIFKLQLCAEELMQNLVENYRKNKPARCFDVHIVILPDVVTLLIKDDNFSFDPTALRSPDMNRNFQEKELGLALLRGSAPVMNYKYMFGQNKLFISFTHSEFQEKAE